MAIIYNNLQQQKPPASELPSALQPGNPLTNPNMSPKKPSFYKQNKWPIIIISLSLLVILTAMYFAFRNPKDNGPSQPKVTLEIEAPKESPSGSEVIYKIHVSNNDSASIKTVVLDLVYPAGFTFIDSVPKPSRLNGSQFTLPVLDPSQDAAIMIKGNLQGNASEMKTITAVMHYQFSNFNSDFVAQAQSQTQIITSNILLEFGGPISVPINQDITYTLDYSNFVEGPVANFKITITAPQSFSIKSTNPKPSLGTVWNLGDLPKNQSGNISITGAFTGTDIGDQQIFTAKAEGDTGVGKNFVLSTNQYLVSITAIPLQASVSIVSGSIIDTSTNGATDVVNPGATVQYKVSYRNNGTTPAKGVNVVATLDGSAFDLAQIQAQGANINNNKITWDASLNSGLASLQPSQSGDFIFTARVKNPTTKSNQKNMTLKVTVQMTSADFQQPFVAPESLLKIATIPQIDTTVTYATGTNPPKVGESTTYTITLSARNTTNDISDSVISFNLPNISALNGIVAGSPEQQYVNYDETTKKMTWNIGVLTAHAGTFSPLRKLQFNITVTPGPTHANQALILVNNIRLTGTDSFTALKVNASHADLTTTNEQTNPSVVKP